MNSQQLREQVWKSKIAVKVEFNEIPPLYLFIYRQHYLLYYYKIIFEHIQTFCSVDYNINNLALNHQNQILPYQVPFGVLMDLHQNQENFTPISLVVIFCQEGQFNDLEKEIYAQYFFNLKQAILVKFKHAAGLNMLLQYNNQGDLMKLLQNVKNVEDYENNYSWLYEIYNKILDYTKGKVLYLPLRIYSKKIQGRVQGYVEIHDNTQTIQECLKELVDCNEYIYNGCVLTEKIPALYFYKDLYCLDGFVYFVGK